MPKDTPRIVINIHGGNNQILPEATHAEQHFHFRVDTAGVSAIIPEGEPDTATEFSVLAPRLLIYMGKEELYHSFLSLLASCRSASEVARVVVRMVQEVPGLSIETAKTEPFINILLCLVPGVKSGTTVPNFRKAIVNAWAARRE